MHRGVARISETGGAKSEESARSKARENFRPGSHAHYLILRVRGSIARSVPSLVNIAKETEKGQTDAWDDVWRVHQCYFNVDWYVWME